MADQGSDCLIKEGDQVVIRKDRNLKVVPVRRNSKLWIERCKFFLDSAIGFPYGTSFEVVNHRLVKVSHTDADKDVCLEQATEADEEGVKDNRFLTDTTLNQKLTSETIKTMRKEGIHGEEIVEQLIQNSSTFNQKNEFARQKYIKKKKKKYVPIITVLKPTARLLLEMYYNKGPNRICNLRMDSLGQLLSWANVHSGSKLLVVESCVGLVVGAVLERMGGQGTVIHLFSGTAPVQQAVESFDFPKDFHKNLYSFPLSRVAQLKKPGSVDTGDTRKETVSNLSVDITQPIDAESISEQDEEEKEEEDMKTEEEPSDSSQKEVGSDKKGLKRSHQESSEEYRKRRWEERQKYFQEVQTSIEQADSDGLIVATKFHPTPVVMSLIDFLAPSRPIAIFCQYKEPLMDCYVHLRDRGGVVLLKLTETWLRGYQVLPNRTHPIVNMSGGGGYLLTGTTVAI